MRDTDRLQSAFNDAGFVYIWQYEVDPKCRQAFVKAYRANGDWAQLFARDPAYLHTELLESSDRSDVFITIDYWRSRAARDRFRQEYAKEFNKLDAACEEFTVREEFVGDFGRYG